MIYLSLIAIIFLTLLFLYLVSRQKERASIKNQRILYDSGYLDRKWQEIETTFELKGSSHFQRAIIEADKLTDYLLKAKKFRGNTFAERLKDARKFFNDRFDYDNLWTAHKVRNEIVHQTDYEITHGEAKKILEFYKKSLVILRVK